MIFPIAMPAFFRHSDNSISEFNIIVAPVSTIKCSLEVLVGLGHEGPCFEFVSVMDWAGWHRISLSTLEVCPGPSL